MTAKLDTTPDTAGPQELCQAARAATAGAGKPALADRH
jgi:hypothetical protein